MTTRRQFLGLCGLVGAGGLTTRLDGLSGAAADPNALFRSLYGSLSPDQRTIICKPWDDASRQLVNTGPCVMTAPVEHALSPQQKNQVTQLFRSMCSTKGFERQQYPAGFEAGMLGSAEIVIYGTPDSYHQISLNGGHLMVRGGRSHEGEDVFGGPIAYGSQLGNDFARIPGNPFRYQTELANDLLLSLDDAQLGRAVVQKSAFEMNTGFRPVEFREGIKGSELHEDQLQGLTNLLDSVFANYDPVRRDLAHKVVADNGGLEGLHVAWYADRRYPRDDATRDFYPVWRVEGPGLSWHFQGWPHVHAYLNLSANEGRRSMGSSVGELDRSYTPRETRDWLQSALAYSGETKWGYHMDTLSAGFYQGTVTEGDIYSFLPFRNKLVVATIKPAAMAEDLKIELARQGYVPSAEPVRVSTLDYYATRKQLFGEPDRVERLTDIPPRAELVAFANDVGLPS